MPTDHPDNALRLQRLFEAPPALVFAVFTQPELVSVWFASSHGFRTRDCTIDLRPGGTWRLRNTKGDITEFATGVYHEVVPDRRLVYSYHFEGTAFFSVISLDLSATERGTRLDFLQTGFPDAPSFEEHNYGWNHVLDFIETALLARHGVGAIWQNPTRAALDGVARDLEAARERAEPLRRNREETRFPD